MKVLLVNGSPCQEGNTFVALSEAAKALQAEGIDTEIFQLGNRPVRGCIACGGCRRNGNGQCVFDDDVCNRLCQAAATADGFVFGSPVYYGQPNGAMLAVLQRALFANGKDFEFKPYACVAVCRRGGATAAFQSMNMAFQMMNMPQVTSQYWNIAYGAAPGETSADQEGLQTMRTMARNMTWMLRGLRAPGCPAHPGKEAQQRTNFIR